MIGTLPSQQATANEGDTARTVFLDLEGPQRRLMMWWLIPSDPHGHVHGMAARILDPRLYHEPMPIELRGGPAGHRRRGIAHIGPDGFRPVLLRWTIEADGRPVREIEVRYDGEQETVVQMIALFPEHGITILDTPERASARAEGAPNLQEISRAA